jgi:hypothetical protein
MTSASALYEMQRFELTPHVIFTSASTGREAWNDLCLASRRVPLAIVMGRFWRSDGVGGAVRDFVRESMVDLDVVDDAWCVWRDID